MVGVLEGRAVGAVPHACTRMENKSKCMVGMNLIFTFASVLDMLLEFTIGRIFRLPSSEGL